MGKFLGGLFGGGGSKKQESSSAAPQAGTKKLFNPEQITQATKNYTTQGMGKWGQVLANMGAASGTGGPDLSQTIQNQASTMGQKLGELTTGSGYGEDGMGQLASIMKDLEGGAGFKYSVY